MLYMAVKCNYHNYMFLFFVNQIGNVNLLWIFYFENNIFSFHILHKHSGCSFCEFYFCLYRQNAPQAII